MENKDIKSSETPAEELSNKLEKVKEVEEGIANTMKGIANDVKTAAESMVKSTEEMLNREKLDSSLFATKSANSNQDTNEVIREYNKQANLFLRTRGENPIEEGLYEKAVDVYIKQTIENTATPKKVEEFRSELLQERKASKALPYLLLSKTVREGVNPDGGYLARRPELGPIQTREFASLAFRDLATVQSITAESIEYPIDDGLFGAAHAGEESARQRTANSQVGTVVIKAGELYAYPQVTLKMIEDGAIDIVGWINSKAMQAFDQTEEQDFMVGEDLNDRPKGLFKYDSWTTNGVYERGKFENFTIADDAALADATIECFERLPKKSKSNAVFMMNPTTWIVYLRLKDGVSRGLLNPAMLSAGYGKTLYGRPVVLSEYIPSMFTIGAGGAITPAASGTRGIVCGDMSQTYVVADRLGVLSVQEDPLTQPGFVNYYMRKRVGGGAINFQTSKFIAIT